MYVSLSRVTNALLKLLVYICGFLITIALQYSFLTDDAKYEMTRHKKKV